MLSPTAAGVRVPGSPEEVRSAGETNMSREQNKSKFGGRLGYILNDSTALPRVTFSNGLIRDLAPADASAGELLKVTSYGDTPSLQRRLVVPEHSPPVPQVPF